MKQLLNIIFFLSLQVIGETVDELRLHTPDSADGDMVVISAKSFECKLPSTFLDRRG